MACTDKTIRPENVLQATKLVRLHTVAKLSITTQAITGRTYHFMVLLESARGPRLQVNETRKHTIASTRKHTIEGQKYFKEEANVCFGSKIY